MWSLTILQEDDYCLPVSTLEYTRIGLGRDSTPADTLQVPSHSPELEVSYDYRPQMRADADADE